ncbi:hypothetical protein E1B28_009161 [Marasmius oreades]|uniref:Uncharacterized protein n=1 Tax=Marasmius oreades TaxID=181124 RepID=A0A9P7S019_9AGAR|nr:uncharacterized protein E1B28_009161 [Marasmius oreades]KAG7092847.1 hypothetical protein E1B28_009161 [Marasmius oreades]
MSSDAVNLSENTNLTLAEREDHKSAQPLRRMPARKQLKPTQTQSQGPSTKTERPDWKGDVLYVQPFDADISEVGDTDSYMTYDSDNESAMSCTTDPDSDSYHPYILGDTYEECGGQPLEGYEYRDEDRPVTRFGFASKKSFCRGSCCSRKSSMSSMCSSAYSADRSDLDVDEEMEM